MNITYLFQPTTKRLLALSMLSVVILLVLLCYRCYPDVVPKFGSKVASIGPIHNGTKIIKFQALLFGEERHWRDDKEGNLFWDNNRCENTPPCRISLSAKDFIRSDAVVFNGASLTRHIDYMTTELFKQKTRLQKWVWLELENEISIADRYDASRLNNMIDITITHRRDADIFLPYSTFLPRNNQTWQMQNFNYAKGRDKLVLWISSNCKARLRLQIVRKLAEYASIDVYGMCSSYFYKNTRNYCSKGKDQDCEDLKNRYKFYLAFENHNCRDYVTEKYWDKSIASNLVPILVAGEYNKGVLIPGSYINILDFPNPQNLANYLKYLDKNDTAYNEYFKWKLDYRPPSRPPWLCALCQMLHNETLHHKDTAIKDFGKFWAVKGNCNLDSDNIKKWLVSSCSSLLVTNVIVFACLTSRVFYTLFTGTRVDFD